MKNSEIFDMFADKLAQIILYQRAVKRTAQKELKCLEEYAASLQDKPDLKHLSFSHDAMHFYDAKTGTARRHGLKVSSIEDRYLSVILHKNKQYQWLIAEAYEEFEDFLERAYAFSGYTDSNFWPMSDFGQISLSELSGKGFDWHLEQARNKRDVPHSILSRFRKHFPDLAEVEVNNALNVNLALVIVLIEYLRHVIVHKGGVVSDRTKFIERVLRKAGLYNNGKYENDHVHLIEFFFGDEEYENTIALLEIKVDTNIPLDITYGKFGQLTGYLMAYAHILSENIESTISEKSHNNPEQSTDNAAAD